MKHKGILLALYISCTSASAFAADQVIKEDTNPSAPEGALTVDQIQPLFTPAVQAPPAPKVETPAPTPSAPAVTIETAPTDTITSAASLYPPVKPTPEATTTQPSSNERSSMSSRPNPPQQNAPQSSTNMVPGQ